MAESEKISITGARVHNLKDIDLEIPRDALVVITGLSGSGKSSLAFDTICAEGQRRYMDTLSAYARQFIGILERPDIDDVKGLSTLLNRVNAFDESGTVGIDDIEVAETDNAVPVAKRGIYDLYGRKVTVPGKGIYIVNGKKILFK